MKKNILLSFLLLQFLKGFDTAEAVCPLDARREARQKAGLPPETIDDLSLDDQIKKLENYARSSEEKIKGQKDKRTKVTKYLETDTLEKVRRYLHDRVHVDTRAERSKTIEIIESRVAAYMPFNYKDDSGNPRAYYNGGHSFGLTYTWFMQDILNPKKNFTEFLNLLNKWDNNYKNMPEKDDQLIDQTIQRIRRAQAYQDGESHTVFRTGNQKEINKDMHIDDLLIDSGLFRRRSPKLYKLNKDEVKNNFLKALEGQDKCMLAIEVCYYTGYQKYFNYVMGAYQEKAGGPILFYDPAQGIQTVKDAEALANKVMKVSEQLDTRGEFGYNIDRLIDVEAEGGQIQSYSMKVDKTGDSEYLNWKDSKEDQERPFNVLRPIMKNMRPGDSLYLIPKAAGGGVGLTWSCLGAGEYSVQYELDGKEENFSCNNEDDENKMFAKMVNYMKEIELTDLQGRYEKTEWDNFMVMPAKANPLLARLSVNNSNIRASDSSAKEVKNSSSEGDKTVLLVSQEVKVSENAQAAVLPASSSVKSSSQENKNVNPAPEVKVSENAQADLPKDQKNWGVVDGIAGIASYFKGINLEDYSEKALRTTVNVIHNVVTVGKWWYTDPKELSNKLDSVLPDLLIKKLIEFLEKKASDSRDRELLKILLDLPAAQK